MKIVFIRAHLFDCRSLGAMPPLVFALLKAKTPPEVELELFDERVEPIPLGIQADLVAITVETYTARRAYQIATEIRRRGIPVVLGGYHVSFAEQEALQYADAIVVGDADDVWKMVVDDARQGRLQKIYRSSVQPQLAGVRFDRSIFRGKRYSPLTPIQFGRGCRFACDFCSIHAFYGDTVRARPVEEFVAEIRESGKRYFLIVDDNLLVNKELACKLFLALIPLKITWTCQVSIDIAHDRELMDLLARSGCIGALIGFESLNFENLRQMKKGWNVRYGGYQLLLQEFYRRGIMVYGSFIFGYDHDREDVFDTTTQFAIAAKLALVNFTVLTPTPGAGLYNRLQDEGRLIFENWWLDPRYRYGDATFLPAQMTPEQLTAGALRARKQFYSQRSIITRSRNRDAHTRSSRHLALYFLSNYTTKLELNRKIGRSLGAS